MLFDRDYRILTEEEIRTWEKVESTFKKHKEKNGNAINPKELNRYYNDLPLAALHHKQLFPNNYLNLPEMKKQAHKNNVFKKFEQLLDNTCTEREILNFIKDNQAYYIIATIFDGYRFGHHNAFLFREFELPPNFVADFLLVGKSSGGFEFIFIELESPYGQITNKDGSFGTVIRKGIRQINDWDDWIEKNYYILRLVFEKNIGTMEALPKEFFELEKSRIHYVVVAGRRSDYVEKTYQLRRKLLKSNNILLMHYDNLLSIPWFMRDKILE